MPSHCVTQTVEEAAEDPLSEVADEVVGDDFMVDERVGDKVVGEGVPGEGLEDERVADEGVDGEMVDVGDEGAEEKDENDSDFKKKNCLLMMIT